MRHPSSVGQTMAEVRAALPPTGDTREHPFVTEMRRWLQSSELAYRTRQSYALEIREWWRRAHRAMEGATAQEQMVSLLRHLVRAGGLGSGGASGPSPEADPPLKNDQRHAALALLKHFVQAGYLPDVPLASFSKRTRGPRQRGTEVQVEQELAKEPAGSAVPRIVRAWLDEAPSDVDRGKRARAYTRWSQHLQAVNGQAEDAHGAGSGRRRNPMTETFNKRDEEAFRAWLGATQREAKGLPMDPKSPTARDLVSYVTRFLAFRERYLRKHPELRAGTGPSGPSGTQPSAGPADR